MQNVCRILVLDDDKLVLSSLKVLFSMEGFNEAVFFNAPAEALEYLKHECADVIISDFMMEEMNGIDFLSSASKLHPGAALILLTGYADKQNAIRAINEIGLYKYIEKPWDNDELIINIKNAAERAHLTQKLEETNRRLKDYSEHLEMIVKEKTADILEINERLSAVINSCADAVITITKEGIIKDANPAAESLFGMVSEMLKTKNIKDLCEAEETSAEFRDKGIIRDIYALNAASGRKIPVEISSAYIPSKNEEKNCVLVIRDVHYQKEMEALRSDFIAALAHDLRTPSIASIRTLEYFLDGSLGSLNDKQKMLLGTMKKSFADMLGLVNTLLEVYKYEAGRLKLVKTPFDFEMLIDECIEQVKPIALSKNQKIEKICTNFENSEVTADRNEIRRVIVNLLGNAVKYTQEGGLIRVKCGIEGAGLRFSVKDNGAGIDKKDIPLLFKRFSQGTQQKRSIGTGLGLYLSKQIIDAHGGKIWLESSKGEGSEFSFLLLNVLSVPVKDEEKACRV